MIITPINRSPGCKSDKIKVGMNNGDDSYCDISSMSEAGETEEPWAIRFAEMLRLSVAQNLLSFKGIEDINGHIKTIGDQVKLQIGLEPTSDMWSMFDQYFDSILYSEQESRLKKIVQNTVAGVYNFVQMEDFEQAIQMMQIDDDFKELR